jgi:hypothetical protein
MPITLDGTNGITTPMYNGSITANAVTPSVNMKNRIINGAMVIDQRNAGASVTGTNGAIYPVDRFPIYGSQNSKLTAQQNAGSVTPPVGFSNYLGVTSSSAYSVVSSDYFMLSQRIEGFNIADLNWGTANAKTVTLSFWVRSSLTGTFGGSLVNNAGNRNYPYTYTISSANTWEQKSVTIAGDTSGTWLTTNGMGIALYFGLGVGSTYSGTAGAWGTGELYSATGATSVVGTNGATFYITGVQLEVGSTATSFDTRSYGQELLLCQRYYTLIAKAANFYFCGGYYYATNSLIGHMTLPVQMRTTPTSAISSGAGYYAFYSNGTGNNLNSLTVAFSNNQTLTITNSAQASGTSGYAGGFYTNYPDSFVAVQAEL